MKKEMLLVLILLIISVFCGCEEISDNVLTSDRDRVIGTWKTEEIDYWEGNYTDTIIFFSDGTLSSTYLGMGSLPGVWELKDGKFVMTIYLQEVFDYIFSNNDKTLILKPIYNGKDVILHRKT